jgi:hypothetical protein
MAVGEEYIVNFSEASAILQRQLTKSDLPTIDTDQVKWRLLEMFEHVEPLIHLDRIISDMLAHDYLYAKVEFVYTTAARAKQEKIELDGRLRSYLHGFGIRAYQHLKSLGMLNTGYERYKVVSQSIDYETYILQRIR